MRKFTLIKVTLALGVWVALYLSVKDLAHWIVFSCLRLSSEQTLGKALEFFLYDTAKIFLLLTLMVYLVGLLRAGVNAEKIRDMLSGRGRIVGYLLASLFGALTPFCSCSSIPLFLGFTMAGIPIGVTMAFLITSPIVNEVAVVLLAGILGVKFMALYVGIGISAGMFGGMMMDFIRADRWLQPYIRNAVAMRKENAMPKDEAAMTWTIRHEFAVGEVRYILSRIWLWVIIGVGIGALLHGYVPDDWLATAFSSDQWWSVPLAVVAGVPLYTNVTGIVPVMESLISKGLPIGTTMAFCLSTVAVSLPEFVMLKQVMTVRLLTIFALMLMVLFTVTGLALNSYSGYFL